MNAKGHVRMRRERMLDVRDARANHFAELAELGAHLRVRPEARDSVR